MFMNYQGTATVSPTNGATGTWSLDGQLLPNPFAFGTYSKSDSTANGILGEFTNTQIPGATHGARLSAFLDDFTRWRLAYASVTIYQDGPDLANQGTVVVAQKPVTPAYYTIDSGVGAGTDAGRARVFHLTATDMPNYNNSQAMPNAYFGKSKDGAYIPLKLTHSHQAWHSKSDLVHQATNSAESSYNSDMTPGILTFPTNLNALNVAYPFITMNDLHWYNNGGNFALVGSLTSEFCNENWADFSFRNLSVQTSLSFFFRFGFECQVQPGSMLSPHLKLSPEYDQQALDTYFKISRELKDAYPAEYNDLGKIWDVISGIAKTVAPALSAIPVVGPALSMAVPTIASLGDRVRGALSRTSEPTMGSTASSSDLELVRRIDSAPVRPKVVVTQALLKKTAKKLRKKNRRASA
jgi:hypothetical protein